jgi:hypothetical protein
MREVPDLAAFSNDAVIINNSAGVCKYPKPPTPPKEGIPDSKSLKDFLKLIFPFYALIYFYSAIFLKYSP